MSAIYDLKHITRYRYANPVQFGEHRAIFLPVAGSHGRILSHSMTANIPVQVRWMTDTQSNHVALLNFNQAPLELEVTFRVRGEHFGYRTITDFPFDIRAEEIPIQYTPDEWMDMMTYLRPHAEDPDGTQPPQPGLPDVCQPVLAPG